MTELRLEKPDVNQWRHAEKTLQKEDGRCACKSYKDMFSCAGYVSSMEIVMPEICGNLDRFGCERCLYVG